MGNKAFLFFGKTFAKASSMMYIAGETYPDKLMTKADYDGTGTA